MNARNNHLAGSRTMVVSPHYLASRAGARILAKGGNAFDAAVAVSANLAVVYPHMTGLGGDAFWLLYSASDRAVRVYNGSGRSGGAITRDLYAETGAIPHRGPLSAITVPGIVDSWDAVLSEYGTLTLAEALAPAIEYAERGFPCSRSQAKYTAACAQALASDPDAMRVFLPNGRAPSAAEPFRQRALAATLRELAAGGRDGFYKGGLARKIVSSLKKRGGKLSLEDFASHRGNWDTPLFAEYRGYTVLQAPPNSQGFVGLMALNVLEQFDLAAIGHGTFEYVHLLVETLKLAFRDRNAVLTDPDFADIPLDRLLDKAYARRLVLNIDFSRALPLRAVPVGSDTAYAAVVDGEGNAVSFIQSLYFEFGSAVMAGETGILLQNRGSFFSLDPAHVNRLEPRKRTFHTLMPAMILRDGEPYLLYGTMGGEGQPQTQTALVTRLIDFGMSVREAVESPRWLWGRTWGEETEDLRLEARIPADVADALAKAGHRTVTVGAWDDLMGHAQVIKIEDGIRVGCADPRSDGAAAGW